MIGILAPLAIEAQALSVRRDVLLHISGMGAQRAQAGAERLIQQGAKALISWGTAGGLSPVTQPGQLILPHQVHNQNGEIFETDIAWKNQLQKKLDAKISIHEGVLLQVDRVIHSVAEKQALFAQHQAIAVDMESAAVAAAARRAGLPFIAMRAVTDTGLMALPRWLNSAVDSEGALHVGRFIREFLRHPETWVSLLRLSRHFSAAQKTLAAAARGLL